MTQTTVTDIEKAGQSRVFIIEDRAAPGHTPVLESLARADAVAWQQGTITPIRVPSADAYDQFEVVDEIIGAQGFPDLPIDVQKTRAISKFLKIVRKRCAIDIQVHIGECQNPNDFNRGWDIIAVLENARPTNYQTSSLGAINDTQQAPVTETIPFTGRDYYEIKKVRGGELAAAEIYQPVIAVAICDSRSCGTCGNASDGCQKVFALQLSVGVSPGLAAEILYSSDGGSTVAVTQVTTLSVSTDPTALACVGDQLVVVAGSTSGLHYATTADVLAGTETWTNNTLSGAHGIFSLGSSFTWVVGTGGVVYFLSDITTAATTQSSAGSATAQDLVAVHGIDNKNLIAVGGAGAVIVTADGETWSAATPVTGAPALKCCWMKSSLVWFAGTGTGQLWVTEDAGSTWRQIRFNGDDVGTVESIFFSTPTVGWISHTNATKGRILRTIDGGHSWYVIPEEKGQSIPANNALHSIVGCGADPNLLFAGGVAVNGTDGMFMRVA